MKKVIFLTFFALLLIFGFLILIVNFEKNGQNEIKDNHLILSTPTLFKTSEKETSGKFYWKKVLSQAPWSRRDSFGILALSDKICIFGGIEGGEKETPPIHYEKMTHKDEIWCSLDGKSWELIKENAEWGKRRSMGVVAFKGKIFLIGGLEKKDKNQETKNDVWISEDLKNWQFLGFAPFSPREGHATIVFQDKIWVIGGVDYFKRETKNDIWVTEDGKTWTQILAQAPWESRWDHAVAVFQNKLWLIGGMNLEGKVFRDVWVSEDGVNWKLLDDHPPWKERQGHALLTHKEKLWLIGRWDDKDKENDVWYTENGIDWKKIETPWEGREDFGAVVFQDRIWIMGGMDNDWSWRNDVWVLEEE